MPRIELIPEVLYQPQDPYHWEVDNLPLKNILRRQNLINLSVDNILEQIRVKLEIAINSILLECYLVMAGLKVVLKNTLMPEEKDYLVSQDYQNL